MVEEGLGGGPLERDTPTLGEVVLIGEVMGHSKVSNLGGKLTSGGHENLGAKLQVISIHEYD